MARAPLPPLTQTFRSSFRIDAPRLAVDGDNPFLAFAALDPTPWCRRRHAAGASDLHNEDCARALLAWYARERRGLPWRTAPGVVPDPYRVWLSEIMLQQTTVKAMLRRYADFLRHWPD